MVGMMPQRGTSWVVDRRDPVPLHHQVRRAILDQILSGQIRVGDRLPTESELCEQLGVSRNTLRQAVTSLVSDGVLWRERPRGTFVTMGAVEGDLRVLRSIWEDFRRLGLKAEAQVLNLRISKADADVASHLNVGQSSPVIELARLFTADDEPLVFDVDYFPSPEFDWMLGADLSTSWYDTFEETDTWRISHARQTLTATAAEGEIAEVLRVPKGSPLLQIRRQLYGLRGAVVNYCCGWYRSDRYRFSVVLPRTRETNPRVDGRRPAEAIQ